MDCAHKSAAELGAAAEGPIGALMSQPGLMTGLERLWLSSDPDRTRPPGWDLTQAAYPTMKLVLEPSLLDRPWKPDRSNTNPGQAFWRR